MTLPASDEIQRLLDELSAEKRTYLDISADLLIRQIGTCQLGDLNFDKFGEQIEKMRKKIEQTYSS